MNKKIVQVYYGEGNGKTSAAVGQCIQAASQGKTVIIIQFLKGRMEEGFSFLKKLEPEIKQFQFEKEDAYYEELPKEQQEEEKKNILNGLNFARKVIETNECDVLVLDEVLGLVDYGIITGKDIINLIRLRDDYDKLVLTGRRMPKELSEYVDQVSEIRKVR